MERCLLLCFPDVLTNKLVVDIVGTFGDFGGGETGHLWAVESDHEIVRGVVSAHFGCLCSVGV